MTTSVINKKLRTQLCNDNKIHVLHVDDNKDFLIITKRQLEKQGLIQVDSVISAKAAQIKLKQSNYDAIISDYQMPDMTGLELLEELNKNGYDIPFFLLTGITRRDIIEQAFENGAYRYFCKDHNPELLFLQLAHNLKILCNS